MLHFSSSPLLPYILDLSCLPTLNVEDIPLKQNKVFPVKELLLGKGDIKCQVRETATNGVLYSTVSMDLADLSPDLKIYLPLFCNVRF